MGDVGIVMPVYKQKSNYLRKAIESIRKQTYKNFKFVIVIDGITRNVANIVSQAAKKDKRIQVISYIKNRGTAHALNTGFKVFETDPEIKYLTWVSSDNIHYPNFIQFLRKHLEDGPQKLGLVYSSMHFINNHGRKIKSPKQQARFRKWQAQKESILEYCIIQASFMYKKSVALKVGEYRHSPVEDYDYWLRLTEHCEFEYIPKELMAYRAHSPLSMSKQLKSSKKIYRKKRYTSQLIRLEARQRRNIPAEVTIIFPLINNRKKSLKQLENLLEQTYYNYKLILIDTSPNSVINPFLKRIAPDPRIEYLELPDADISKAIKSGLKKVDSPFVMFYGYNETNTRKFLERLVKSKTTRSLEKEFVYNELYITKKLMDKYLS